MQIPWRELSEDALNGVLEEYATREGTDYGQQEYSLAQKVAQLRRQLERGDVVVDFDPDTESVHLIPAAR